jgi:hypothetical protein
MNGGDKLGEGAHGVAYDVNSDEGDSLYSILQNKNITKITLFTEDSKTHTLSNEEDIDKFVNFLSTVKDKIAKIFKKVIFVDIKKDFEIEVESNQKVIKLYKPKSSRYTTTTGLTGFFKSPISASIIDIDNKQKIFAIFGTRCSSVKSIDPDKFILDILESLSKLQTKGYYHNDIKLNNILVCNDDEYKLIDWGSLQPIDKFFATSAPFTNPLKWYIKGYSAISSIMIMEKYVNPKSSKIAFLRTDIYKEFKKRVKSEFNEVVKVYTREQLKERQANTEDTFTFGCAVLEIIHKFNLKDKKYLEIVNKLTSLIEPLDAKKGLKMAKKILK